MPVSCFALAACAGNSWSHCISPTPCIHLADFGGGSKQCRPHTVVLQQLLVCVVVVVDKTTGKGCTPVQKEDIQRFVVFHSSSVDQLVQGMNRCQLCTTTVDLYLVFQSRQEMRVACHSCLLSSLPCIPRVHCIAVAVGQWLFTSMFTLRSALACIPTSFKHSPPRALLLSV